MSDLFQTLREEQHQRLLQSGWKLIRRLGKDFWEHPQSKAWYSEEEALKWLEVEGEKA